MDQNFKDHLLKKHLACDNCPSNDEIVALFKSILSLLYPNLTSSAAKNTVQLNEIINQIKNSLQKIFVHYPSICPNQTEETCDAFMDQIPQIYNMLEKDLQAIYDGDPAAKTKEEVIRSYPGFYSIAAYRIAHVFVQMNINIIPRIISEHAHEKTGIDIHPNATIGEYFCIDHGTGIVIGETSIIGNQVKIYQGVTLGALSVKKEDAHIKRHPTIGNNVVIYANATILGGKTVIGDYAVIGGNVWLTKSIPPQSTVYYFPEVHQKHKSGKQKVN